MKLIFFILLFLPLQCFSWSLVDKLQYDNYRSCIDHKIKDVDRTKTDMNAARRAFEDDCKKAFCSNKESVTDEEFESCVRNRVELCEHLNTTRKNEYEEKNRKRKSALQRAELAAQKRRECLADPNLRSAGKVTVDYICSDPSAGFYKDDISNDVLEKPSINDCNSSNYYESCKKEKYVDKTCR